MLAIVRREVFLEYFLANNIIALHLSTIAKALYKLDYTMNDDFIPLHEYDNLPHTSSAKLYCEQ